MLSVILIVISLALRFIFGVEQKSFILEILVSNVVQTKIVEAVTEKAEFARFNTKTRGDSSRRL